MFRYIIVMSLIFVLSLQSACSFASNYPEGKITVKVIDEAGKPIEGAQVGIGFEQYIEGEYKGIPVGGKSNAEGKFSGEAHGTQVVSYGADKDGYYKSYGEYRFKEKKMGRWEPWNPEVTVVLRKIKNPIPMYARDTKASSLEVPVSEKEIGFDLVEYDWVAPYGKGAHADFLFKLNKAFSNDLEFDSTLTITFVNKFDGIQLIKEDRAFGSQLKLPRFAPETGYANKLVCIIKRSIGKALESNSQKENNYFFRVRTEEKDGKLIRAMYGKIQGDIEFDPRGSKTARIFFKYYLNPDYTTNLEFDPNQNLFKGLSSLESVGLD